MRAERSPAPVSSATEIAFLARWVIAREETVPSTATTCPVGGKSPLARRATDQARMAVRSSNFRRPAATSQSRVGGLLSCPRAA
jgi:hypothetical protein